MERAIKLVKIQAHEDATACLEVVLRTAPNTPGVPGILASIDVLKSLIRSLQREIEESDNDE
jgi:hypothetical protein